ncbi:MAG: ABC transporter permease [Eubacteriales bacterium]|nr:ABC transporter permease [Eubacteriales bacterium]
MSCEIKRIFAGRSFWAAVLAGVLAIAAGFPYPKTETLLAAGSFLELETKALTSKAVCYLLPVTAVLPWCDSFLEEWKGGFLKACLPRCGRRAYIGSKIFSVALSGAFALFTAVLLTAFGYFLVYIPMEKQGTIPFQSYSGLLETAVRAGLLCGSLSSLGGICAAVSGSIYMAYGLPFVAYYFCMLLHERYFESALWLYPPAWLSADAQWGIRNHGLWLFLLLLFVVTMGIHGGVLYERLQEL